MGKEKIFKLMDNCIMVHSKGEEKSKSIFVPQIGSYTQRMQWVANVNKVYDVAENIDYLKKGDKILLQPHAKPRGMEKLTEIMEKKLGKKLTIDILDKDKKNLGAEEKEKYFIVEKDEVMCIIN